jgi:hypothetical protein
MDFKANTDLIGKKATIPFGKLTINVRVKDYKYTYGRHRWLVEPISGTGEMWVESLLKR